MKKLKKRWGIALVLSLVMAAIIQLSVCAAGVMVTVSQCVIAGNNVNIVASTPAPQSPDGIYYLFELKPYETGLGARKDYCATSVAAHNMVFTTSLNHNTANSRLYSRFVVAIPQNGAFVPVSNEMYITNPEVLATKTTNYPN